MTRYSHIPALRNSAWWDLLLGAERFFAKKLGNKMHDIRALLNMSLVTNLLTKETYLEVQRTLPLVAMFFL
jgi:hypothetical protein